MIVFYNKLVLVLGGSWGIGVVIVRCFVVDGVLVVFSYFGLLEVVEWLVVEIGSMVVQVDSVDCDVVISLVCDSGLLDVLVVNVGIVFFGDVFEQDSDVIDCLFCINIYVFYYVFVEVVCCMLEGGCIIVIGLVNGDCMLLLGMVVYVFSKLVLQGLVCGLVWDFGLCGIMVNVVQFGLIDIDVNLGNGLMKELMYSFMVIKCYGCLEEVVGMVVWLVGLEVLFVIGVMYIIDGVFGV